MAAKSALNTQDNREVGMSDETSPVGDNASRGIGLDSPDRKEGMVQSGSPDCSIGGLPKEVLKNIFSRLSLLEGFKCRPVDSRFRNILDAIPREEIDLKDLPSGLLNGSGETMSSFLRLVGFGLQKFVLEYALGTVRDGISSSQILDLLDQFCPALQVLIWSGSRVGSGPFGYVEDRRGLWAKLKELYCCSVHVEFLSLMPMLERLEASLVVDDILVMDTGTPRLRLPRPRIELTSEQLARVFNLKFIKEIRFMDALAIVDNARACGMGVSVMPGSIGNVDIEDLDCHGPLVHLVPAMAVMLPNVDHFSLKCWFIPRLNYELTSLEPLSPLYHKVQSLNLKDVLPPNQPNESILAQMVHLKSLIMSSRSSYAFLAELHDLEEFSVYGGYDIINILGTLSPRAPLTKLSTDDVNLHGLAEFFYDRRCSLKELVLDSGFSDEDDGFSDWFQENDHEGFGTIMQVSPALEKLSLLQYIWGDWVFGYIVGLPHLQLLELQGRFTKSAVLQFARDRFRQFESSSKAAFPTLKVHLEDQDQDLCLTPADRLEFYRLGLEVEC